MSSTQFVKSLIGNRSVRKTQKVDKYLSVNETWQESVVRVLLTGILKNTFYRSADDMAKETIPLFKEAAKKDPVFLMKALCMARNGHMKGMVKVGLAAINGFAPEGFLKKQKSRDAAVALLATFHPGQLLQFVELCKSKAFGCGFGSRPQKWVRTAMESWNAYKLETYTLKYPKALNQLVRLVHPRYMDERAGIIVYVLDGRKNQATGTRQQAVEYIKRPRVHKKTIANAIIDNNIPWDVVKGFAGIDGDIGLAAMTQMGLSALLLNIRSLKDHGVLSTREGLTALKMKMNEVKNGRAIPIDFAKPYIHAQDSSIRNILLNAIVDSLDASLPHIENKRVGVSIDISGSMTGENLITAGLMAIPFLKARDLWFTTFDRVLYQEGQNRGNNYFGYGMVYGSCPALKGKSKKAQVESLLALKAAGGTDTSQPILDAITKRRVLDVMVLLTDQHQNAGCPLMNAWKQYKARVNSNAQLWIVDISNTKVSNVDLNDPSIVVYNSITPAIFNNLNYVGMDIVDAVRSFDIDGFINDDNGKYETASTPKPKRKAPGYSYPSQYE